MNLNSMMKIYTNERDTSAEPITVGYKGVVQETFKAGFYCPYIPLTSTGVMMFPTTTNGMLYYKLREDGRTYDFTEVKEYENQAFSKLHTWMEAYCPNAITSIVEEVDAKDGRMHYVVEFTLPKEQVLFKLTWL